MEYRAFGKNGDKTSLLGLGLMRLPKQANGSDEIDWPEAQKIVDLAYESGVNYYDTAYFYHGGDSEKFAGNALSKYPRDSYYLATKMPVSLLETEEDIPKFFEEQFRRTGADYFDFYLCHALSGESFQKMERLGLWDYLQDKKAKGLIRHIGFSFHDKDYTAIETISKAHPWEFAQIQFNYLDWTLYHSKEQYEILEKYNIPAIIMEPVRGGRLADLGPKANAILEAAAPGRSIASWAMRWVAGFSNIFTILSGMSDLAQVQDNCETFSPFTPLSGAEATALEEALEVYRQSAVIPCTACRYCVPCPMNVAIPELFALYNKKAFDGDMGGFKEAYAKFPEEENAGPCVGCSACEKMCPQQLPIVKLLQDLHTGQKPSL